MSGKSIEDQWPAVQSLCSRVIVLLSRSFITSQWQQVNIQIYIRRGSRGGWGGGSFWFRKYPSIYSSGETPVRWSFVPDCNISSVMFSDWVTESVSQSATSDPDSAGGSDKPGAGLCASTELCVKAEHCPEVRWQIIHQWSVHYHYHYHISVSYLQSVISIITDDWRLVSLSVFTLDHHNDKNIVFLDGISLASGIN